MQKTTMLLCFQILLTSAIWAQFHNKNAHIIIKSGTNIQCKGDFLNQVNGVIDLAGSIAVEGNFSNEGIITPIVGSSVKFKGDQDASLSMGNANIQNLYIATSNGAKVSLGSSTAILNNLTFETDNAFIDINDYDLFIAGSATITNADKDNFIITSGSGHLRKAGLGVTDFTFPIGFNANSYNPIYINQQGTSETIGAHVLENVRELGTNGAIIEQKVVSAIWDINETQVGENNLTIKCYWSNGDEAPLFDRSQTAVSHWDGTDWTALWSDLSASINDSPYYYQKGSFQEVGLFAVGNEPTSNALGLSIQTLLQGPENGGIMNDYLRILDDFPLIEPYSLINGYNPLKYGGNEEISPARLVDFGNKDNIVDWIYLELRDKNDITHVVGTKALLIQKDGDLTDINGKTNFFIHGLPDDDYYIAIRHRNHLGICTKTTYALSATNTALNFTDGSVPLFGNNPTISINGKQAMIAGDANQDNKINYNGIDNDRNEILLRCGLATPNNLQHGYYQADLNMDGIVKYNGLNNDRNILLQIVGLFTPNNIIFGQLPE